MLNIFRKKINEPLSLQAKDVVDYSPQIAKEILNGINCDNLPNGEGEFGTIKNPIPVNGAIGEIKYLAKLRGITGQPLFFHRIGSIDSKVCKHMVDLYEVVCIDGTQWNEFYFDMYHPRRSNIVPKGYSLIPFDKKLKFDLPIGFGVNENVPDFPIGIPNAIKEIYGSQAFAKKALNFINSNEFKTRFQKRKKDFREISDFYKSKFSKKKKNPAFDYVESNFDIECEIYRKLATTIHTNALSAAEQFARELNNKSNTDIVHFFFDYFLFFFSVARRQSLPKENDAYSAILDGIHIEYYDNVNQDIIDNTIKLMSIKEFCFLKTNSYLYKKKDLRMSITIAAYCIKKPELVGTTEVLKLKDIFHLIHKEYLSKIDKSFENILQE